MLIRPTVELQKAWLECHEEWGPGTHEDGFGLDANTDVVTQAGFTAWVNDLLAEEDSSVWSGPQERAGLYRWILDDRVVVGGIAARVSDSKFVRDNGHVGYGIRPSARRRGIATWALGKVVHELFEVRGMTRVLAVCESGNRASAATIEHNRGRLDTMTSDSTIERYWIEK